MTGNPKPRGFRKTKIRDPHFRVRENMRPQDLRIPVIEGGFPHSEIRGSKLVRNSPRLIAAYYVLHRLSAPRHPPDALQALDCSHRRCPPLGRGSFARTITRSSKTESTPSFFSFQRKDQLASQTIRGCGCRSRRAASSADDKRHPLRLLGANVRMICFFTMS